MLDIGCGKGELREHVTAQIDDYIGADVVRYDVFPAQARFLQTDLDTGRVPLPDDSAEIVAAVETIEHLETLVPSSANCAASSIQAAGSW